jgi:hypothetical protein
MSYEGLPQDLGELFSDGGARRVLDVNLPPGRLVVPEDSGSGTAPLYWLSDEPASPDLWVRLHQAHPRSGLWPVIADGLDGQPERPWVAGEVRLRSVARIDALSADAVLESLWRAYVGGERHLLPVGDDPREIKGAYQTDPRDDLPELLEPFGSNWPGLAPAADGGQEPDEFADQHVRATDDGTSRVLLAPAARSADVVTAVGWLGPCNYTNDIFLLSSVLRSWEERFGARVVEIGFDTLHLVVAAPPTTTEHAEHVAAEHLAFCPDNITQSDDPTIRDYAEQSVRGRPDWFFWWD